MQLLPRSHGRFDVRLKTEPTFIRGACARGERVRRDAKENRKTKSLVVAMAYGHGEDRKITLEYQISLKMAIPHHQWM